MNRNNAIPPSRPFAPREATPRNREVASSYHDSSLDLAGGLEVTDGTVSALPEDLKLALTRLRQGKPAR